MFFSLTKKVFGIFKICFLKIKSVNHFLSGLCWDLVETPSESNQDTARTPS